MIKYIHLLTILLLSSIATAQSVDVLFQSSEYRDFARTVRRANNIKAGYAVRSEYLSVFANGKNGVKQLLDWIGTGSAEFKRLRPELETVKGYVKARSNFVILSSAAQDKIEMTILLPKPSSVSASSWGLFDEFRDLEPPNLVIDTQENVETLTSKGKLYYHKKEGACSIVVKILHGGLLNLRTSSCVNRQHLLDLLDSLDLIRLNQKLSS